VTSFMFAARQPLAARAWPASESIRGLGLPLSEAEASEFAARLIDARSEAQFDHLLGAILTHAAARSGGSLSPELGRALGGSLRTIARQGLGRQATARALGLELEGLRGVEQEFETALQFVRLAGEAARHAAEEPVFAPSRDAARAALAAASEIYAPPLMSYIAKTTGRLRSRVDRLGSAPLAGDTVRSFGDQPIAIWIEPFDYDPEMEYFLGGLIQSVGRAVGSVARTVGKIGPVRDIVKAAGGIARAVGKAAETVGRIPILGDVARAGIGAARLALGPYAIAIDAGSRLARGEDLGSALKGAVGGQINAVRDQLKLAEMVAPFVPGVGTGVAAALGAANALASGRPITDAVLAAARSALPGGKIAQAAFDVAANLAQGKNIGEAALGALRNQLPGGQAAQAAFDVALNLSKGKNLGDAALAAARGRIPGGPAAQAAFDTAVNIAKGKNVGEAALAAARERLPGGPAARAAFDAAVALSQAKRLQDVAYTAAGRVLPPSPYATDAVSFVNRMANGQNIQHAALSTAGQRVLRQVCANAALAASGERRPPRLAKTTASVTRRIHTSLPTVRTSTLREAQIMS
jgi:hypothetical protein